MRSRGVPVPAFGSDFDCAMAGLLRGSFTLFGRQVVHAPTMTPAAGAVSCVPFPFPQKVKP